MKRIASSRVNLPEVQSFAQPNGSLALALLRSVELRDAGMVETEVL